MNADLQSTVDGMRHGLQADVGHMATEAVEGMEDIAADRLPNPDERISLPPSIVALAAGVDVRELAASRVRPTLPGSTPASLPAPSPSPATSDMRAEHDRFMDELRALGDQYQQGTERMIHDRRRKLGLSD